MSAGYAVLADIGNIGLAACAVLDTACVAAYLARARGTRGKWWATPFGVHLMCFMAAFAIVLDQSVIYLLAGPGLLAAAPPAPVRPDWFAWERTVSFAALIPGVLAWRLYLILRPPRQLRGPSVSKYRKAAVAVIGAALEIIPLAFPSASWAAPVIAGLTALSVYLTPNKALGGDTR